jgi:hypothetical protein
MERFLIVVISRICNANLKIIQNQPSLDHFFTIGDMLNRSQVYELYCCIGLALTLSYAFQEELEVCITARIRVLNP